MSYETESQREDDELTALEAEAAGAGLDVERLAEAYDRHFDEAGHDECGSACFTAFIAAYAEAASPRSDAGSEADHAFEYGGKNGNCRSCGIYHELPEDDE